MKSGGLVTSAALRGGGVRLSDLKGDSGVGFCVGAMQFAVWRLSQCCDDGWRRGSERDRKWQEQNLGGGALTHRRSVVAAVVRGGRHFNGVHTSTPSSAGGCSSAFPSLSFPRQYPITGKTRDDRKTSGFQSNFWTPFRVGLRRHVCPLLSPDDVATAARGHFCSR